MGSSFRLQRTSLTGANSSIEKIVISDNKLYVAGYGEHLGNVGIVARYLLDDENKVPTVSITSPADNASYVALADIPLVAEPKDFDAVVKKIQFFNGTTLLATQNFYPYTYTWHKVPAGYR